MKYGKGKNDKNESWKKDRGRGDVVKDYKKMMMIKESKRNKKEKRRGKRGKRE